MILTDSARRAPTFPAAPLILAALLLPLLLYWGTLASIVAIWDRSGTYAHGYMIMPISLWLIWQRRSTLNQLTPQPYWPALLALAGCGAAWMLATLGEVQVVNQLTLGLMLPLSVAAMCGRRMAGAMLFPLMFLLFGVPVGDSLTPPLVDITANFTVAALRFTGIPVLHEGNSFTIPSGSWNVIEACSGVRYLIASLTLGCLYAYLTYRTLWRRLAFVLLSIIVPIFANSGRAYLIVMIGHLSGMRLAVGFDHIIYGWVFFGLVMFVLYWVGGRWREDQQPLTVAPAGAVAVAPWPRQRLAVGGLVAVLCLGAWPLWAWQLERSAAAAPKPQLVAPQIGALALAPFTAWRPFYSTPATQLTAFYGSGPGAATDTPAVGVTLLYYRNQNADSKLISSTNGMTDGEELSGWHVPATGVRREQLGGTTLEVRESTVMGHGRLLVWTWYWIDGRHTINNYWGKLLQVEQRVVAGRDDGAAVMIYAPYDEQPEHARAALRAFAAAHLAALDATLATTRHQP